jgi:hypothetical protein
MVFSEFGFLEGWNRSKLDAFTYQNNPLIGKRIDKKKIKEGLTEPGTFGLWISGFLLYLTCSLRCLVIVCPKSEE